MSQKEKPKHKPEGKPREEVVRAVAEKADNGTLTCAAAFSIAADLKVPPEEVGFAADVRSAKIVKCQLGLFGYGPEKKKVKPAAEAVPPALKQAIEGALDHGRLRCAVAWRIAEELRIPKMEVSSACETMKIKISSCQLMAF